MTVRRPEACVATADHYVSPALAGSDLDRWVADLTRRTIRGTHWSVLEEKAVVDLIREFAARRTLFVER